MREKPARQKKMHMQDDELSLDDGDFAMEKEYDFSKGVRGKYAHLFKDRQILVTIDADVAEVFRNSEEVNQALRVLMETARRQRLVLAESRAEYEVDPPENVD